MVVVPGSIRVVRTSTAQQVANGIAELIMAGQLAPGSRLKESVLATDLGLSRNTVREAVRLLEPSGLVRYQLNRGMVVWNPAPEEIAELYQARYALETAAARLAGDESVLLSKVKVAFEEYVSTLHRHDLTLIVEKDLAFHAAIVALLGSARLDAFFDQLLVELRYCSLISSFTSREYEDPDPLFTDHQRIYYALESRDPDEAVRTLGESLRAAERKVRENFVHVGRWDPDVLHR